MKFKWFTTGLTSTFPAFAMSEEGMQVVNDFLNSFKDDEDEMEENVDMIEPVDGENKDAMYREHNLRVREQFMLMSKQKGGVGHGG